MSTGDSCSPIWFPEPIASKPPAHSSFRLFAKIFKFFTLEKGIAAGLVFLLSGGALFGYAIAVWKSEHFGALNYSENLRRLLPAVTLIVAGIQIVFSSFFLSILGLKTSSRRPPANQA